LEKTEINSEGGNEMLSNEDLMWMYRKLVLLRQAEERLVQLSNQGKVGTLL